MARKVKISFYLSCHSCFLLPIDFFFVAEQVLQIRLFRNGRRFFISVAARLETAQKRSRNIIRLPSAPSPRARPCRPVCSNQNATGAGHPFTKSEPHVFTHIG